MGGAGGNPQTWAWNEVRVFPGSLGIKTIIKRKNQAD
jgi:hypothetical protein